MSALGLVLAALPIIQPFWLAVPAPALAPTPPRLLEASFAEIDQDMYIDTEMTALHQPLPFGDFEVGLTGYVLHGGFMDRAIDEWHEFWGMPLGDRPAMPIGEVLIDYSPGGTPAFRVDGGGAGVAAPQVSWSWSPNWRVAATPVPGVGPLDVWRGPSAALYRRWRVWGLEGEVGGGWFAGVNTSPASHGKAFGAASVWRLIPWGSRTVEVQARFVSRLWDGPTGEGALGDVVAEGGLALAFPCQGHTCRLGFTEDLRVGTSADFALWFARE